MKLRYFQQIFEKYPHINFNNIPSSGGRDVPCGRTDGRPQTEEERHTDMTKLIVTFAILQMRLKIEIVGLGLQFWTTFQSSPMA